jgi:hypothetical protein
MPKLSIRYKYEQTYNTHIIEVRPSFFYYEDSDYKEYESFFEDQFEESFPNENILFITEDSLNKIDSADYEFKSNKFNWAIDWDKSFKTFGWNTETIDSSKAIIDSSNNIVSGNCYDNYALAA